MHLERGIWLLVAGAANDWSWQNPGQTDIAGRFHASVYCGAAQETIIQQVSDLVPGFIAQHERRNGFRR